MKTKRILAVLLALFLSACLLAVTVSAAESGSCGSNLAWTLENGVLTVSGQGPMFDYYEDNDMPWGNVKDEIRRIVIEDGVTSIGDRAFCWCEKVEKLILGNTVENIGNFAFGQNSSLVRVEFPDSLVSIEGGAFMGSGLESIEFGKGLKRMEGQAFGYCGNLTSVTVPASLEEIGDGAFGDCANLMEVLVETGSQSFSSVDGALYNKDVTEVYCVPAGKTGTYTLPTTVDGIFSSAFWGAEQLTNYVVADGHTSVYSDGIALYDDEGTLMTVPKGYTGTYDIDSSCTKILDDAFNACQKITRVTIPAGVERIMGSAFNRCQKLNAIIFEGDAPVFDSDSIFQEVKATAYYPTGNTAWTQDVMKNYGGTITWVAYDPANPPAEPDPNACGDNLRWTLEDGVLTVSGQGPMFDYYEDNDMPWGNVKDDIKHIVIEDGVTAIGDRAFCWCQQVQTLTLGNTVENIGNFAFGENSSLTQVKFPDSVVSIEGGAFMGSGLESVEFGKGLKRMEGQAFSYCNQLKQITFLGDQPAFESDLMFEYATAEVYVNIAASAWGDALHKDFGGNLTWVVRCDPHNYVNGICTICADRKETVAAPKLKITINDATGKPSLSWGKVDGAVKYKVYRAISKSGNYNMLTSVDGTGLTDNSAVAGKSYYYYVIAQNANDVKSAKSNIVGCTCDLAQPVIKLSSVSSSGKIKISWNQVEGATKYEVYRATSKSGTYNKITTTKGTSVINTSAVAGKTYYYKVRAICNTDAAASVYSAVKSLTCDLAQPVIKLSNVSSSGKIKVSWEKITGAGKYEVWRATSKTGTYKRMTTTTNTSYTDTSASAGKTYYYKVKAIHSKTDANSAYSAIVSKMCDLKRPTLTVKLNSKGKPALDWNEITGAAKYRVHIYNSSGDKVKTVLVTSSKYTHSSASKGKTYSYRVEAVCKNTSGNSTKSTAVKIKSK